MKEVIERINQATGNSIDIIQRTAERINEERASEAAASMAYYGFFSLFPLLLVAVVVVSTVLENTIIRRAGLRGFNTSNSFFR